MIVKDAMNSKRFVVLNLFVIALIAGFGPRLVAEENSSVPQSVDEIQNVFRQVSRDVLPSVVEILTTSTVEQTTPQIPNFEFFFGPQFQPEQTPPQQKRKAQGLGSGIMVRRDGGKVYVLTNNHVVDKAQKIQITLNDGRKFYGKLVGADPQRDLALISFNLSADDKNIVLAKLGDSDELQVGDWVLAIGNPLGLDFSVTHGIVSALGRHGGPDDNVNIDSYIQTDAAINRGNSGGALVNLKGEVVGINTWIATPNGANVGLGFAIPINSAKRPIEDFIAHGVVKYGWLGALVTNLSPAEAQDLGLSSKEGAFIPSIFRGSPAEKAGILPGDFVTAINGKDVRDTNALVQIVGDLPIGQSVDFKILRQGQKLTKTVDIQERGKQSDISNLRLWPGLTVATVTQDIRDQLNLDKSVQGVVVAEVQPRSTVDIAGIKPEDVVTSVNGVSIRNIADFYRIFNSKSNEVDIGFVRQGVKLNISISR